MPFRWPSRRGVLGLVGVSILVVCQLTRVPPLEQPAGGVPVLPPLVVNVINVTTHPPELSLKTPFYIYEDSILDWWNATLQGKLVREIPWLVNYKHSDDYWMLRAARNHPLRTRDPSQAKLFFVPLLWNLLSTPSKGEFCTADKAHCGSLDCQPTDCYSWRFHRIRTWLKQSSDQLQDSSLPLSSYLARQLVYWYEYLGRRRPCRPKGCYFPRIHTVHRLLQQADQALSQSPWFQRHQGRDHLIVASHFDPLPQVLDPKVPTQDRIMSFDPFAKWNTAAVPHLTLCNLLIFEGIASLALPAWRNQGVSASVRARRDVFDRIGWPALYIGKECGAANNKTHDFAFVGTLKPRLLPFQMRSDVCQWLAASNASVAACGGGPQCPAVAQAKYGFHIRGDTLGSNRLMDILLSGSIPLCTHPGQYDILPPWLPWREMTYLADASSQAAFDQSLHDILSRPPNEYQEKLKLIERYRPYLDHSQPYQFDMYMTELARSLGHQ